MGQIPTEIENLFANMPDARIPKETDLCDMLLYYTVMIDLGFPEADGQLLPHIVDEYKRGNKEWSTLFQYYGTKPEPLVKELTLDLSVHTGTNAMRKCASYIFFELGWIKGLDTAEEDGILLEQLEPVERLSDRMIHTFLINRQMLRNDWWRFFQEDFSLYKPYFGDTLYDTNIDVKQT
jgi:hypothetical protein